MTQEATEQIMPAQIRYWFARQPLDVLEREFSILEGIMLAKREAAKFVSTPKERKKRADAGKRRGVLEEAQTNQARRNMGMEQ